MTTQEVIPSSSGFTVRWLGRFAVVKLPADPGAVTAPALAGELCAVLDAGAPGLIVELPGSRWCDSACLDALMRAARRARAWGSWLRLVVRDPGVRAVVRLVALDAVMPVHPSVSGAVAAAAPASRSRSPRAAVSQVGRPTADRWAGPRQGGRADLLTVEVAAGVGYTLMRLAGEADVTVRGQLAAALAAAAAAGPPCLVLDVSGLNFIDVSCLRVLWRASRAAELAGGTLRLAVPRPLVARLMQLSGADQVIGVHGSVAEAAAAAAG